MIATEQTRHQPVLLDEVLQFAGPTLALGGAVSKRVLDCTVGGGGHSEALLASDEMVFLVGIDRDPQALDRARKRLEKFDGRVKLIVGNFSEIDAVLADMDGGAPRFQVILADFGISSDQLEDPTRGFSFSKSGPLDMRMNQGIGRTAEEVVNQASFAELRSIFRRGGVGNESGTLANEIVKQRPVHDTIQLAAICQKVFPVRGKKKGAHPATVPFQALRIEINDELNAIQRFIDQVLQMLAPGGRLIVISFHSLEDQIVTRALRRLARGADVPHRMPGTLPDESIGTLLTKQAVTPTADEMARNPRARSARMRVFEKNRLDS